MSVWIEEITRKTPLEAKHLLPTCVTCVVFYIISLRLNRGSSCLSPLCSDTNLTWVIHATETCSVTAMKIDSISIYVNLSLRKKSLTFIIREFTSLQLGGDGVQFNSPITTLHIILFQTRIASNSEKYDKGTWREISHSKEVWSKKKKKHITHYLYEILKVPFLLNHCRPIYGNKV